MTLWTLVAGDYMVPGLCLLGKELETQLWSAFIQQPQPSWPDPTATGASRSSQWARSQLLFIGP